MEKGTPGFEGSRALKKLGMHSSDTAELVFDGCRVPVANLIGEEGEGFKNLMWELQGERMIAAAGAIAGAQRVFEYTADYARNRQAFGQPISQFQVIKHKLVDMGTEVAAGPDGRILAVGAGARAAAGRGAEVVRLRGAAWPGLIDAHIHLEGLADWHAILDLGGTRSLEATLTRVERWSQSLPRSAWVVGAGWYNDAWLEPAFPTRLHLDRPAGAPPLYLLRQDGHSPRW